MACTRGLQGAAAYMASGTCGLVVSSLRAILSLSRDACDLYHQEERAFFTCASWNIFREITHLHKLRIYAAKQISEIQNQQLSEY